MVESGHGILVGGVLMIQEEKDRDLLLRDLCERLPYGVKVKLGDNPNVFDLVYRIKFAVMYGDSDKLEDILDIINIKPYLFPLSTITKEMMEEPNIYGFFKYRDTIANVGHLESKNGISEEIYTYIDIESISVLMEFFHSHHIDYRGLIEKGLAIDATGLNIY